LATVNLHFLNFYWAVLSLKSTISKWPRCLGHNLAFLPKVDISDKQNFCHMTYWQGPNVGQRHFLHFELEHADDQLLYAWLSDWILLAVKDSPWSTQSIPGEEKHRLTQKISILAVAMVEGCLLLYDRDNARRNSSQLRVESSK